MYKDEIEEYNREVSKKINRMTPEEKEQYLKDNNGCWGRKGPDGYNCGGYDWCCENWGTKWNFCDPTLAREDDDSLYYEFETAWSPPEPVIRKMGERFPMLRFELRYFEGGMGFNGILVVEDGQVVEEVCADYFGHRGG